MFSYPQIIKVAEKTKGQPFIGPLEPAQEFKSAAGNTYFRQEVVLYDTHYARQVPFTHICNDRAETLDAETYVIFDVGFFRRRAVGGGQGSRPQIVLELAIPAASDRHKIIEKVN